MFAIKLQAVLQKAFDLKGKFENCKIANMMKSSWLTTVAVDITSSTNKKRILSSMEFYLLLNQEFYNQFRTMLKTWLYLKTV